MMRPPFARPRDIARVPHWRNGRRGRLKICCPQGRAGSSPAWGTRNQIIGLGKSSAEFGPSEAVAGNNPVTATQLVEWRSIRRKNAVAIKAAGEKVSEAFNSAVERIKAEEDSKPVYEDDVFEVVV